MKKIVIVFLLLIIGFVHCVGADTPVTTPTTIPTTIITPPYTNPVVNIIATPTSGDAPLTVQFTGTASGFTPSRWVWEFEAATSHEQNPSHIFSYQCDNYENSAHKVYLIVLDKYGNEFRANTTIQILNIPPPPVASFSANPSSGPAPLTVEFTDTSTGSVNRWGYSFGDGQTSNLKNPVHNYTISGVYTVQMHIYYVIKVNAYTTTSCYLYQSDAPPKTITVLSPLPPTIATPTQTATTVTTTTLPTTSVPAQIPLPTATVNQTITPSTTMSYYTPQSTAKPLNLITSAQTTSIPMSTTTQGAPIGIEISILAISAGILLIRRPS